jgi:hypothetical protein
MSVAIAINKIKEDEFIFKNEDIKKIDEKKLSIGFNVAFDWDIEKEDFFVRLTIHYTYDLNGSKIELVRFSTTTGFHVKGLKEILNIDGQKFQLPDFFMLTFVSTAVSSTRGMLSYKLSGTFLSDYYLPFVDPKDFLSHFKHELPKEKKAVSKKTPAKKVAKKLK